jgi:hypothetical protein
MDLNLRSTLISPALQVATSDLIGSPFPSRMIRGTKDMVGRYDCTAVACVVGNRRCAIVETVSHWRGTKAEIQLNRGRKEDAE